MTYIVEHSSEPPYFLASEFSDDWELRIPELKRRADISDIFRNGRALLDPADTPVSVRLKRPFKRISDIFDTTDGLTLVSAPLHDLIEEMDPGLHQFIPIFLLDAGGRPINGTWFVMNVHFEQDSIVDEVSTVRRNAGLPEDRNLMSVIFWSGEKFKLTADPKMNSAANLWREKRYPGSMLLSDALVNEIKARKLKFQKLRKVTDLKSA